MASFRSLPALSLPGTLRVQRSVARLLFLLVASALPARTATPLPSDDLTALEAKARSGDKWERKRAVEGLARLGTREAWELVLAALADERGEVADTAQWVLGELEDEKLLERLRRRDGLTSKDPWIRERVTELFGRLGERGDLRALIGQLDDREASVRSAAYLALSRVLGERAPDDRDRERIADAARRRLRGERDPHLRAQALAVFARVGERGVLSTLEDAAKDREAAMRAMAASLLTGLDAEEHRDAVVLLLERLVEDRTRVVRARALEAAARIARKDTVRILVERIGHEPNARLERRVVELLQGVSGLRHRHDPRPWNAWCEALPDDWHGRLRRVRTADPGRGRLRAGEERTSTGEGLPVLSDRPTFLIDLSGSIWQERADGTTKKERVDEKLREALGRLPEEARFNLIPFTSHPIPWKERLKKASRANVTQALRFFEELRESGSGNVFDAIRLALRDPETDTVVLLGDGAPTGGPRHRLELLIPMLLQENSTRGVAFDIVLVGATHRLREHWRRLADSSGGNLFALEL